MSEKPKKQADNNPSKETKSAKEIIMSFYSDINAINAENGASILEAEKIIDKWLCKKSKEQIIKILQRVYKRFTIHGGVNADGTVRRKGDFDGNSCIFLLKKFGFIEKTEETDYVTPGDFNEGGINMDTGGSDGVFFLESQNKSLFGSTLILDHHPKGVASASYIVYRLLKKLGMIPSEELKNAFKFVSFVNLADYYGIEIDGHDMKCSHKNIFGLRSLLDPNFIYRYLGYDAHSGFEHISEQKLNEKNFYGTSLKSLSERRRIYLRNIQKKFREKIEKGEFITLEGKKYILDLKDLNSPYSACVNMDTALIRIFDGGKIQIYNPDGIPEIIKKYGYCVRDKYMFLNGERAMKPEELNEFFGIFGTESFSKQQILDFISKLSLGKNSEKKRKFERPKDGDNTEEGNKAVGF